MEKHICAGEPLCPTLSPSELAPNLWSKGKGHRDWDRVQQGNPSWDGHRGSAPTSLDLRDLSPVRHVTRVSPKQAKHTRDFLVCSSCVCVHPWTKGFLRPPQSGRGRQGATESLHGCRQRSSMQLTRISRLITVTYLPQQLLTTLSNWLCLFPWFFMLSPPNILVPSSCAADLFAAAFVTTMLNLSSARTHAPFCSLTFLPNVTCVN